MCGEDIFQCSSVVTWAAGLSVCRQELKLRTDDGTMKVALSVKVYTKKRTEDITRRSGHATWRRDLHRENTIVRSVRSFGCAQSSQSHVGMLTSPTCRSNTNVSVPREHHARCSRHERPRTLSPPLQIVFTTVQSSYRVHWHFPWHGNSFTRSTMYFHVNVALRPLHSSRRPLAQAFSRVRAEVAFQSKSAVFSNLSTVSTFTYPSTLACCNQRLLT